MKNGRYFNFEIRKDSGLSPRSGRAASEFDTNTRGFINLMSVFPPFAKYQYHSEQRTERTPNVDVHRTLGTRLRMELKGHCICLR